MKVFKNELGKQAFELLLARIRNPDTPNAHVQISTCVSERDSVAALGER
jgi:DNA-binding LacI/PurR family transcriptional regulator